MLLLFLNTRRADMKCISYFAAALCLAVVAGCGGGGDPEQEEHAHHEFPDHRPGNYKEAVSAISQRSWELANRGGKIGSLEFGHFVDIITWIPEMAADSDMRKADWDKANNAAGKMRALVLAQDLDIRQLESVVADELSVLKSLVDKAGEPETNLHNHHHHHGHDHGHHDDHDHDH